MANHFATQGGAPWVPPTQDPYFTGDQLVDTREILGGPPNTTLWKKNGKTGQMQPFKFKPYEYQEYPKTMYGIGVDPLTVTSPDEEESALKLGYVDHPSKVKLHTGTATIALDNGVEVELETTAMSGDTTKTGKRRGRPAKNPVNAHARREEFNLPDDASA